MTASKRLVNTSMILAGLATCLVGWGTYALFSGQAGTNLSVTAGRFDITLGDFGWSSTTGASGAGADSLADVSVGDGDVLVLSQAVSTSLVGHNLQAAISVDWADAPAGATATWHLADSDGRQVAPEAGEASLDHALTPPALVGEGEWLVVVTAKFGSGNTVYGDPAAPPSAQTVPLGVITVTASQVRG